MNPILIAQCPWHVHLSSPVLTDAVASDSGLEKPSSAGATPRQQCPELEDHHRQQQHSAPMTQPLGVVYYQQQPADPNKRSTSSPAVGSFAVEGEQFAIIDEVSNESTLGRSDRRQWQKDENNSSPTPHHGQQRQQEPRRLIGGEMSSTEALDSHFRLASIIFGPFNRLSMPFFPNHLPHQRPSIAKRLLFYGLVLLLLGRAIFYMTQLGGASNLSLDWARDSLQLSISLNALGALAWMYQSGGFPRQFVDALVAAIGGQTQPKSPTKAMAMAMVTAAFFFYTSAVWALQRVLQVQLQPNIAQALDNGTHDFAGGNVQRLLSPSTDTNALGIYALYKATLLCLDALICLLAGFIGALVLGIFQLSFSSTLAEWERFKAEQVDEPMDSNGQLTPEHLHHLSNSASSLLRFAHMTSNMLEQMGMGMFMTAIFCNLSANFIVGGGGSSNGDSLLSTPGLTQWPLFNVIEKVNNVNWSILSIIILFTTVKGPYDVHSKVREVKEQLLLEDRLWNGSNQQQQLTSATRDLVRRLEGIRIHRIGTQLFQLVFIAQMVLVWLLVSGSNCTIKK